MVSFLDLFEDLEAHAQDTAVLDLMALERSFACLLAVAEGSAKDDRRFGPLPCKVRLVGDPEIVDCKGNYFHYLGPALLVNLDGRGMVRSLEFVGVEGGKKNQNYIRDVWHYDVRTQKYKFRDLREMQGEPAHAIRCKDAAAYYGDSWMYQGGPQFYAGDGSWDSEREPDAVPPLAFLREFKPSNETFFVNCRTGTFIRGPRYGLLKAVIEDPARLIKPLMISCSKDPDVWMQQAADAITERRSNRGKAPMPCRKTQAVQVAQVVYGLVACVAA